MKGDRSSVHPALFLSISEAYLRAFDIVRSSEANGNWLNWDFLLLFHPMSHLIGISMETAAKGLIACRTTDVPKTHDLSSLLGKAADSNLAAALSEALEDLSVPPEILDVFELEYEVDRASTTKRYRNYLRHVESLNQIYASPYATRYPVLGTHPLPDPEAPRRVVQVLHDRLELEMQAQRSKSKGK